MSIRILVVDDHSVERKGLSRFIENELELEIVGEAADGAQEVHQARALKPNVVSLYLLMPVMDGIQATSAIRRELPETEVVAPTSVPEDASVVDAVRAGVIGYLLKNTQLDELIQAIKAAAAGQVQLSPEAAARLHEGPEPLTDRETDVLRLLASGLPNKEIARELNIGEGTVKSHVSKILAKLRLPSRTQAALYAVRVGLVAPLDITWPCAL